MTNASIGAACGLDPAARAARLEEIRAALAPRLLDARREGARAVLRLRLGAADERRLAALLARERRCCSFWRFSLRRLSQRLVELDVAAAPPHGDALDALLELAGAEADDAAPVRAGEAARRAGVGVETPRYYERRGVLPPPRRRPSGHREYAPVDVRRVRAVRAARGLGLTLAEIGGLLRARPGEPRLRERAEGALVRVEGEIRALERTRARLAAAIDAGCDALVDCACGPAPCPLDALG